MNRSRVAASLAAMRAALAAAASTVAACALMLTACTGAATGPATPAVATLPSAPPTIRPDDLVGRWAYAAYYNEADRPRIEAAARGQCSRPIEITRGPNGGVVMPIPNQGPPGERTIKGAAGGRNFIGPPGEPGSLQDSEVVSFDGKVLVMRTVDTDETGHLSSVYVRCGKKA